MVNRMPIEGEVVPRLEPKGTELAPTSPPGHDSERDQRLMSEYRAAARRQTTRLWAVRVIAFGVFLAIWEWSSGRTIEAFWISSPSAVAVQIVDWLADGTLVRNLLSTLRVMGIGFTVGVATAVSVGFLLGRVRFLARLLTPFIQGIYSMPKLALAPLFIMWFGIGITSKVLLTVMIVFFMVFYNTFSGVRDVDRDLLDVAAVLGASRRTVLLRVVLPSAAEWIFTGLRLAVPYSLVGAVVGEILAGNSGIGYLVRNSSGTFDVTGTFAALMSLIGVGMVINSIVEWSSKYTGRWRAVAGA